MKERTASMTWGLIGLFCGVALGAVTLFGLHLFSVKGAAPFAEDLRFWGLFPRTYGVVKGTPVRLNGIEVGEVEAVEIVTVPDGEPMVALAIVVRDEERYGPHVRTTSRLTIGAANLIGDKIVEISASSEGEPLAAGTRVVGDPPLDVQEALDRVGRLVTDLADAVDPEAGGADTRRMLRDLEISLANLREVTNEARRWLGK
ncbi:MAG: MlaD family protein [Planctomycetota bacterium]|jgi:ABC-type transporter Mla subunit MlaD